MTYTTRSRTVVVTAALALMTLPPSLSMAQDRSTAPSVQDPMNDQRVGDRAPAGRLARRQPQQRQRAPQPPSAEEVQAAAQGVLTATNTNCQISESKLLGQSPN